MKIDKITDYSLFAEKIQNQKSLKQQLEKGSNVQKKNISSFFRAASSYKLKRMNSNSVDVEFSKLMNRIEQQKSSKFSIQKFVKVASVVLLLINVTILGFYFYNENTKLLSYKTEMFEKSELMLKDGSRVIMKEKSELTILDGFNMLNRNVAFYGDAIFDIRKSDVQFMIQNVNFDLTVLGTKFNLNTKNNKIYCFLERGKVKLKFDKDTNGMEYYMKPNDILEYDLSTKQLTRNHLSENTSYSLEANVLSFSGQTIYEIVKDVNLIYKSDLKLDLNSSLAEKKISVEFKTKDVEEVAEILSILMRIRKEKINKKLVLTNK
jgi:ferric-dicitrate binding protein FerR (iron transport regulator)